MPNRRVASETAQLICPQGDQNLTHTDSDFDFIAGCYRYSGALLASVLQGVESSNDKRNGIWVLINPEHPTLITEFTVIIKHPPFSPFRSSQGWLQTTYGTSLLVIPYFSMMRK